MRLQTYRHTFFPPYAHINPFDFNEDNMHVVNSRRDSIMKVMQCETLKMLLLDSLFSNIFVSLILRLTYTKVLMSFKLGLCYGFSEFILPLCFLLEEKQVLPCYPRIHLV